MTFILCPQTLLEHLLCIHCHARCCERWRYRPWPAIIKGKWMMTKALNLQQVGLLFPRQSLNSPHLYHHLSPPVSSASFSGPFPTLSTPYMVRRYIDSKFFCLTLLCLPILGNFSLFAPQYEPPLILRPGSLQSPLSPWLLLFPILSSLQFLPLYLSLMHLSIPSPLYHLSDASIISLLL